MRILAVLILSVMFLTACTETQLASHVVKTVAGTTSKPTGHFKVGNPYVIMGKRYIPEETYSLTETGIASWYGPQFHGKKTANGEIFDMYELTAAHRTLQMPSLVRVTNLENGRSLIVRVNDRGPFARGRIIDLSKRSAELLGMKNQGTAKVRVQVLGPESRQVAEIAKSGQSTSGFEIALNEGRPIEPRSPITTLALNNTPPQDLAPAAGASGVTRPVSLSAAPANLKPADQIFLPAAQSSAVQRETLSGSVPAKPVRTIPGHQRNGNFYPDPVIQEFPVSKTDIFVQAASFGSQDNASRYAAKLGAYGPAKVFPAKVNGKQFYRVRIGPMQTVDAADVVLNRLAAEKNTQAIIVVE